MLDSPHIFVFGELLDLPAIKDMADSPTHKPYLELLKIFAYGKYRDFLDRREDLPDISAQVGSEPTKRCLSMEADYSVCDGSDSRGVV